MRRCWPTTWRRRWESSQRSIPCLGYEKATELAQEAYKSGKGILEIIREKKVLTEAQIKDLLDPVKAHKSGQEQIPGNTEISSDCTSAARKTPGSEKEGL